MDSNYAIEQTAHEPTPKSSTKDTNCGAHLVFKYSHDEKTKEKMLDTVVLSSGEIASAETGAKFREVLKQVTV
jgi:hypothetical protein